MLLAAARLSAFAGAMACLIMEDYQLAAMFALAVLYWNLIEIRNAIKEGRKE